MYNENFKVYAASDFIAALTKHIPPARVHLVRYYGLYSSRGRGIWKNMTYVVCLAPEGWIKKQEEQETSKVEDDTEVQRQDIKKGSAERSAWARLINKVYGINPLICEKCGSDMCIVAFIMDLEQIDKIIKHLKKQGRPLSDIPVLHGTCTSMYNGRSRASMHSAAPVQSMYIGRLL